MVNRRTVIAGGGAALAGVHLQILGQTGALEPIKVGFSAGLSGDAASYGKPFLEGAQVAAEEINKAGGVLGRPFKIIFYDDRGIPDQALQAAKKLVFDDKVNFLQPGSTSGAINTAMVVGKQAKVGMWGNGQAKQWVTDGEGMIFRATVSDRIPIGAMAKFAHARKVRRVGLIHVDTFYGESIRDTFKDTFEELGDGAKVVAIASHPDGSRDVSSQLLSIAKANIDAFYMGTNGSAFAPVLRQSRQFLPRNILMMTDSELGYPSFRTELKELAIGAFYSSSMLVELNDDPLNQKWIALLKQRLGYFQEIMGRGVVGMLVLKEAIERAKSLDGITVMKEVHKITNFPTPAGPYTYDPRDGEGLKTGVVIEATGTDPAKDRIASKVSYDTPLYKERINFDKFFGPGYKDSLYKFKKVS